MARDSIFPIGPGTGALPDGRPPTTFEWNEFEARLDKRPLRFVSAGVPRTGRTMRQLPTVTDDQARACGPRLLRALERLTREVAQRGQLDDLVLVSAWMGALRIIDLAAAHVVEAAPTEEVADDNS